ncbi:MAG: response regulator transcription factor [Coriobacteriia bacterium]|nr:response regulator transcription factor [Coriobacteriia bacterium]
MTEDPIHVLVVDDDAEIVEMARIGLEAEGMRVFGAADGAEAIELIGRDHIDVVVLDIIMPRVDGWMTLMDIRSNPLTATLPVIMLSAKTEELAKILAFRQGVQQYVNKPFSVAELAARIESLVRGLGRVHAETGVGDSEFRKLPVRKGGRMVLLNTSDIVFLSARHKSTYAHTYENQYLVDTTLGELEEKYAHDAFTRVHRSYLVNLNKVKEIVRQDGCYYVVAADRDETHIPVARRQVREFRETVGI